MRGGEDTWTGRMDVLQLNMVHNYKHILTHLEKRHQVQEMEKVHIHTHTRAHSTNKHTYNYLHHTQAHMQMHTGTHIHG